MNVLHLELGRYRYGGAEQVRYLLEGAIAGDHHHTLITAAGSDLAAWAEREGHPLVALPYRGEHDIGLIFRLVRTLKALDAQLLHVHSRRGADWMGPIAARIAGVPAILSRRVDHVPGRWLRWLMRHHYRRTIAISRTIHDVLQDQGVAEESLLTISSAVDTTRFANPVPAAALLPVLGDVPAGPVIGIIAQLIERKGHRFLFEALPGLVAKFPTLKVVCFGQGPLARDLHQQVVQGGLERHVVFAGFRADLDALLGALTLVVHPALREGLGVSLLKAAAAGVPVVGFRAGGVAEVVVHEHTGLLVAPGDHVALGAAIGRVLGDAALHAELSANARSRAVQQFSVVDMVQRHAAMYDVLMQEEE